jgi:hypothetical protein
MELFGALNTYHVAFVVLAMGLAGLAGWSRRRLAPRVYAVSLFAALMVVGFGSLADLLGRPKPAQFDWFRDAGEELQVLGSDIRENEAIYLWVRQTPTDPPRAYALPWNMEVAKQLFGAQNEAQESGRGVRMRGRMNPEAADDENEPVFYPDPQEALPPKQAPGLAASPIGRDF